MASFLKIGVFPSLEQWLAEYGDVFCFRLMTRTFVFVADPDAARTAMFKLTNHAPLSNPNFNLVSGNLRAMNMYGLLTAMDDYWRAMRNAWQPAFAPASLRGYQELMDREALAFASRLESLAAEGEAGPPESGSEATARAEPTATVPLPAGVAEVEFHSEIARVTLAVVGTAAYGVDFHSPEFGGVSQSDAAQPAGTSSSSSSCRPSASSPDPKELSLAQACDQFFRTMNPGARSRWATAMALPCLLPLVRPLANLLPDRVLARHIGARRVLRKTALRLMDDWRQRNGGSGQPSTARSAGGGVAPGSFLGLMLSARDKGSGRALTDMEIQAQVETFMLAGFETTANALAFSMYLLAAHPDKARRLQQEIDQLLPPLPPPGDSAAGAEPEPLTMEVVEKLVYTEAVIQEAMRLYPPAHGTSRLTDRPINLMGHDIPTGVTLWISVKHVQARESLWPQAEAFLPERFLPDADPAITPRHPHAHFPFGAGTRMCIGHRFALQEAKTVLARLFQRCSFELAPSQEVPLQLVPGVTLSPKNGVRVRVYRRQRGSPTAAD